jgi:hypothetical protein
MAQKPLAKAYRVYAGTIANGQQNISLGIDQMFTSISVTNKTSGKTLVVKLNSILNDELPVDTTYLSPLDMNDIDINNVYLSNTSGSSISYLIILMGI